MSGFTYSCNSKVDNAILDNLRPSEVITSVGLSIKASHAGKTNNNFVFYTPRSMRQGAKTLIEPFKKHLQKLHRGDAVGVINDTSYRSYADNHSELTSLLADRIDNASSPKALVKAVKDLIKSDDYNDPSYKGLGVLHVSANLYDNSIIKDLTTGTNKGKVSIGGNSNRVFCSVCSEQVTNDHRHKRGVTYLDDVCFYIYDKMVLDHIGFVPDPADTSTETSIIQDSLSEDFEETVTIDNFKIQDNLQGYLMNIEQLKELSKDVDSVLASEPFTPLSPKVLETLKTQLVAAKTSTRKSNFLFGEEKLIPLSNKESVAVAKLLITSLEDSTEKESLEAIVQSKISTLFKDSTVEDLFKELEEVSASSEEPKKEEGQGAEGEGEEQKIKKTSEEIEAETKEGEDLASIANSNVSFTKEDLKEMLTSVVSDIVTQLETTRVEQTAAIQDSVNYKLLIDHNKQLSSDIATLDEANASLSAKYKEMLVKQILTLQDRSSDVKYKDILVSRDISSLSDTLEGLEYLKATNQETQAETVHAAEVKQSEELEKANIEDSFQNLQQEAETKQEESALDIIKNKGLAEYLKLNKGK